MLWIVGTLLAPCHAQTQSPAADEPAPSSKQHVIVEGQITNHLGMGVKDAEVTVRWKTENDALGEVVGRATTDGFGDFAVRSVKPVRGSVIVTVTKVRHADLTRELVVGDDDLPPYLAEVLEGDIAVTGRVERAEPVEPVAGVSVTLRADEQTYETQTDAEGLFKFQGVSPGPGEVVVTAPGFGRERRAIRNLADANLIVLSLRPGRVVRMKVVDDRAKPIAGVQVGVLDEANDDFRAMTTDENGQLTIDGLNASAQRLAVRLTHDTHVSSRWFDRVLSLPADKLTSDHTLTMQRAGQVTGVVTDARSNSPLHGARVITGPDNRNDTPRDWSDVAGHYDIRGVPPGWTVVTVHLSGFAPELSVVNIEAGETATLDLKLSPGVTVSGRVVDQDRKPIAGAFVDATRWRGHRTLGLRTVTGQDGAFIFDSAPVDEFEITVGALGKEQVSRLVNVKDEGPIELTLKDGPPAQSGLANAKVKVGDPAPAFSLTTLDGKRLDLKDLKGKVVVVDFWATWCGPCVAELPHLIEAHKKLAGRPDVVMVGVSLDDDEDALKTFLKKRAVTWPQAFGEQVGGVADRYGVVGIPALFLIDADGKIAALDLTGSRVSAEIERVAGKTKSP